MGLIPPQQVYAYEKIYNMLLQHNGTFRNGKDGHDDAEPNTPTLARHAGNERKIRQSSRAERNENGALVNSVGQAD